MCPYYIPKSTAFYLRNYGQKIYLKKSLNKKKLVDMKTIIIPKKHS